MLNKMFTVGVVEILMILNDGQSLLFKINFLPNCMNILFLNVKFDSNFVFAH